MSHWDLPPEEPLREDRVVERRVVPARRRRVTTERRVGGGGFGMNPVGAILAGVLIVFILVLLFGYLL